MKEKLINKFEDLRIWQKAHELMIEIFEIIKKLPVEEKYRIKDQIERSSSSVGSNIAEGYTSFYFKDKIKCLYVARKEAGETQNHIRALEAKKYIGPDLSNRLVGEYQGLIKGINAFINYIRDKQKLNPIS